MAKVVISMVFIREENIPEIKSRKVINEKGVLIAKTWCGFSVIYLTLPTESYDSGGRGMREEKPRMLGIGYRNKKGVFYGIVLFDFPLAHLFYLCFLLAGIAEVYYLNNFEGVILILVPFIFSALSIFSDKYRRWLEEFKYRIRKG